MRKRSRSQIQAPQNTHKTHPALCPFVSHPGKAEGAALQPSPGIPLDKIRDQTNPPPLASQHILKSHPGTSMVTATSSAGFQDLPSSHPRPTEDLCSLDHLHSLSKANPCVQGPLLCAGLSSASPVSGNHLGFSWHSQESHAKGRK